MKRVGVFLYLITWLSLYGYSQVTDSIWLVPAATQYSFISPGVNVFINPSALDSFYYKLSALRHGRKDKVAIIHIGDSHLQADGITAVVRNGTQAYFGDAGRGLVFPYQLAGSNAPLDLKVATATSWKSNKIITSDKVQQPGVAGYMAHTSNRQAQFKLYFQEKEGVLSTFNQMRFFMSGEGDSFTITDSSLAEPLSFIKNSTSAIQIVNAPVSMSSFELKRNAAESAEFNFYGVSLEKQNAAGILYHTIGVNGARLDQYVQSPLFWHQLKELDGDLFIISLGTNEAQNPYLQEAAVALSCDSFLAKLHQVAPHANVLITVPAGSYYLAKKPNKSLVTVQSAFKKAAQTHKTACWDLLTITGGFEQIPMWKKHALLAHDLVHYTNAGYHLQGELLLQALSHHYNQYARTHIWKAATPVQPHPVKKTEPIVKEEVVKAPIQKKDQPTPPAPAVMQQSLPARPSRDTTVKTGEQPKRKSNIIVEYEN